MGKAKQYLCGCPERFGDGTALFQLPTNRPLFFIRDELSGFSRDVIAEWIAEGFARWGAVCDLKARRIMNLSEAGRDDVVQLVTVADLGTGGVLADQQLPSPGAKVLQMRINTRIKWKATDGPMTGGTIDPIRTVTHETGHFLGMQHFDANPPPELMEPRILQDVNRPQPAEAKLAASWFGQPVAVTPDKPPVVPTKPEDGEILVYVKNIRVPGYRFVKVA